MGSLSNTEKYFLSMESPSIYMYFLNGNKKQLIYLWAGVADKSIKLFNV